MFFRFAFLVHEAALVTDGILRIIYRKFISKKNLLEWQTAAQSERLSSQNLRGYFLLMAVSPIIALVTLILKRRGKIFERGRRASPVAAAVCAMKWILRFYTTKTKKF